MPGMTNHARRINVQQFAKAYIANGGNGTEAVLATKPMKRGSAAKRAMLMLKRSDVQTEISEALKKHNLSYEFILGTRKKIVQKGLEQLENTKISAQDVHNHLVGIEKIYEKIEKKEQTTNKHLHLHLENKGYTELMQQRQTYNTFFNDILEGDVLPASMKPDAPAVPLEEKE